MYNLLPTWYLSLNVILDLYFPEINILLNLSTDLVK